MAKKKDPIGDINKIPNEYNSPFEGVASDFSADHNLIESHGMLFQHWRAIPNVIGAKDPDDIRHIPDQKMVIDNIEYPAENGFLYMLAGNVYAVFVGNSRNFNYLPAGYYGNSVATLTVNGFYDDSGEKVAMGEFDKLVPTGKTKFCEEMDIEKEFFNIQWQVLEHNPSGVDVPQFNITKIETVIDSDGIMYKENIDFKVNKEGFIEWLPKGKRPGIEPSSGKGKVLAIRYWYLPYFYVKAMIHEVRIKPSFDPLTGDIKPKKAPLQAAVQADWVFRDNRLSDTEAADGQIDRGDSDNVGPR